MNCSRCAAELPDASTFCPKCGTANPSGQLTTAGFSYLPAGAPPWPTTIPAKSAYATDLAPSARELTSQPEKKSRRLPGNVVMTGILIALIIPLLGVGGTLGILASQGLFPPHAATPTRNAVVPKVQATPTAAAAQSNQLPTPKSFKMASIKDVNVSLAYPADWVQDALQKTSTGNSLAIHPQQQLNINFSIMRYSTSLSTTIGNPDVINQSIAQGFAQTNNLTNPQTVTSTGAPPTIGGITWSELEVTLTDSSSNSKIDLMSVSVLHNKIYYNIYVFAPDTYYNEAMQKYIQHMFSTFKFLS